MDPAFEPIETYCRPEVLMYARAMEAGLRKHDDDRGVRGWIDDDPRDLYDHLYEEILELYEAVVDKDRQKVVEEAPHVGAMAMMIMDIYVTRFPAKSRS